MELFHVGCGSEGKRANQKKALKSYAEKNIGYYSNYSQSLLQ